jgi:hypothetical protein
MIKKRAIIISLILSLLCMLSMITFISHAEEVFPKGCKPLVVDNELISIPKAANRLIMIHNLSTIDLWITHPVSEPGVNAGWSSRLQAGHWSALAIHETAFELSCIESKPGHEQQIPCKHVVGVCQWLTTSRPQKPSGIFWAGEDMALSPLTAYIGRRGFVVPNES